MAPWTDDVIPVLHSVGPDTPGDLAHQGQAQAIPSPLMADPAESWGLPASPGGPFGDPALHCAFDQFNNRAHRDIPI